MAARVAVLLLLVALSVIFFTGNVGAAGSDEGAALLALKAGFVDPLGVLDDWKTASLHCRWTGVRCNAAGLVDGLDLAGRNLSGSISGDLLRLPALAILNISSNSFAAALPKSLSPLSSLQVFDVSQNSFEGSFPAGLGSCADLVAVNGSGNNFVGPLPVDLANATSLESIDMRGAFFSGHIPAAYGRLAKLKFLGLSGNNIGGKIPSELGEMEALESLLIGYNELEGPIPPELGNLASLQYLDLAIGNLNGAIPPEIGRLPALTELYLYKNKLVGKIPPELGNASSLVFLDLSDNLLTGPIPAEMAHLSNLQLLNLMCNHLNGAVPAAIADMPELQVLELWNNSLSGPLPSALGQNSPLQWVDVSSNAFTGGIPAGICDGKALAKLIMFRNGFTGEIPAGVASCASLERVRAQGNRLNGTIPAGFGKLPLLERLELAGNDLSGEIPGDLASSTSLSFIDVSRNRLQGSLPSSLFSIAGLQSFLASGNLITGELPDEFQDCPALGALDLSGNRLVGKIPSSLASCQRLVNLNLQHNGLTGEIPPALAKMPALAILDLSSNLLSGGIPDNFGNSPALETLNLANNNLTGPVPGNGVLRTINPSELAGNAGLCGGVLPPCSGSRAAGLSRARGSGSARIRHAALGWLVGTVAVVAAFTALFGGWHAYRRWYVVGGAGEYSSGAWPWRLTAFQRLGFTCADVLACIKESNVVGMGATGVVYKAELPRARAVIAVKKLWRPAASDANVDLTADVLKEVGLLGRLRHRNIVRLLGYIHNDADAMMLYEFMPNGSLWEALHGGTPETRTMLVDWVSRYDVAAGVAQGLAYLHHDCHPPVLHRDIKSNNILLDADMQARVADFGLARALARSGESVSVVAGSYGYIAPEYGYTLKVDQKSDIYSYGVVLMELITGRRAVEAAFGEGQDIVGWVRDKIRSNTVEEHLDPLVGGGCAHVREEMLLVLRIAVLCTAKLPRDRPSMRDVLTMLGEAKPRRKSGSSATASNAAVVTAPTAVVDKDKPVFSTTPDSV
ncbi:MDIS1-interacting receptor like kinase 1-like [Lolium rigidum]|uniref:MDIS1-interacting receptor like kinase 1-like n=1 Tax=Lolium rigidum TaxID=89674 RepID=UPI001F5C8893|nr:MDIS1-interacting receptor like kinase 1-like [Lolium rigidum]